MTSAISPSTGTAANWLASAFTAIKNSQNQGGLLGMLQNAASGDGSISSFLSTSQSMANNLATISTNNVSSAGSLYAQMAAANLQKQQAEKLQKSLEDLAAQQNMVAATNVLDPIIFLGNGTTINTNTNIMTMQDGTQYDTVTGLKYVDPNSIIQMSDGSYLNTSTNILTMADGTQIDTVTGLKVTS